MAETYVTLGAAVIVVGLGLFYRHLQYRQGQEQAVAQAEPERARRAREEELARKASLLRERLREHVEKERLERYS